jgi:hypothetical protein
MRHNPKKLLRERTAARPFAEKLSVLERIRERDSMIRGKGAPKKLPAGPVRKK